MVQSGKQLELTVACGLAKGDTVHVLGRIQGGSDFLAWMADLVLAGEDDLVDWDDEKDVIKWMMEGRDGTRSRGFVQNPEFTYKAPFCKFTHRVLL